jgi:ATP-binding cassette subfamily B multidrug efflux pump
VKLKQIKLLKIPYILLGPIFYKYRMRLGVGLAAILLVDTLQLSIPRVIKSAIDGLNSGSITTNELWHHSLLIFSLAAGVGIFRFIWRYLLIGFSRLLEKDLRNKLFSHLLTLDKTYFQRKTTGELMALSTNDLAAVQLACGMGLVASLDALVMLLAGLSFMIYIHPTLTLMAILPMPILAFITKSLSKKLHFRFRKVQEQFSTITEFARTAIASVRLVKIYNQEQSQAHQFARLGKNYVAQNIQVARIQGALFPISAMIANISLLLIVVFGGKLTIDQQISLGDFVAFISYLFMLTWPMMAIGWVANLFQRGLTSLERIKEVLDEKPTLTTCPTEDNIHLTGQISLANLNFTYPTGTAPVLNDISLEIGCGLLGIVGKTGSGKSTLCDLLCRIYQVPDESIFFDGIDVNSIPISTVRKMISFVPQTSHLFSDTIAFNIALAKPDASEEEIKQAAKMAAIHKEISSFPNGYQTTIGEKGIKLSGGQRQRIALAQSLLADRPIIIIDDGLSAVDVATEDQILTNLAEIFSKKTIIFTSHRLAPLTRAKQIAVMEDGRIADLGTAEELLLKNNFFKTIYDYQHN